MGCGSAALLGLVWGSLWCAMLTVRISPPVMICSEMSQAPNLRIRRKRMTRRLWREGGGGGGGGGRGRGRGEGGRGGKKERKR